MPHLLYPLILPQTFRLLSCLRYVNNKAMNLGVQICLQDPDYSSFETDSNAVAGSYDSSIFIFTKKFCRNFILLFP